jgi:hypothetical protein
MAHLLRTLSRALRFLRLTPAPRFGAPGRNTLNLDRPRFGERGRNYLQLGGSR